MTPDACDIERPLRKAFSCDPHASVNGLSPRYWRERAEQTEAVKPAPPPPAPEWHSSDMFPQPSETTSELRRRVIDAGAEDGPRLRLALALPIITVLSVLPWVAMGKGLDIDVLGALAAFIIR